MKKQRVKVLFLVSEAVPFIKTGGLADVAGTLPIALKEAGADVRVMLPKYMDIPECFKMQMNHVTEFSVNLGWRKQYCGIEHILYQGINFYFLDNEFYFARNTIYGDGNEEGERFGFFCKAALEALPYISFYPDILHCHDWQTGFAPALLKLHYKHLPGYSSIKSLYTIHNIKYQGVFGYAQIDDLFGLGERYFTPEYLEFYGGVSFMKAGIVFSEKINTVSPSYAYEIQTPYYGERFDGLLRARGENVTGILNGLDYKYWDPAADTAIAANYDKNNMENKKACKAALLREFSLPENEDSIVIGIVSRLTEQKGLDLIKGVLDEIMRLPVQLVVVGQGDREYQEFLTFAQWRYQGKVSVKLTVNDALAHMVYAGSDIFLMPSRFEPCGLSQIIALRYGTIPIVREIGGLKDTVIPYNKYTDEGTGFSFANYNAHEMLYTLEQACEYYHDSKLWKRLMYRAMDADFGWDKSAMEYIRLYEKIISPEAISANSRASEASAAKTKAAPKSKSAVSKKQGAKKGEKEAKAAPKLKGENDKKPASKTKGEKAKNPKVTL